MYVHDLYLILYNYLLILIILFFHPIQILSDKARLIKRTQLKRTPYRVLGKSEDEEQNTESKEVETEKPIAG